MTMSTLTSPVPVAKAVRRKPLWLSLSLVIAVVMLTIVVALVAIPPMLPGFDAYNQDLFSAKLPPFEDPSHLLGADPLGRDLLSRLSVATAVSIGIAFCAVLISATLGLAVGLIAGWVGGKLDAALMAVGNLQLAVPVILLLIVLVATLGSSPGLLIVLLGLTNWVGYGRVVRSLVVSLREREFITAVTTAGGSGFWVMRKHLLPNVLPSVLLIAAFDIGVVITIESSLSFIGLGVQPPTPSLGALISEGQRYIQTDPYLTLFPALAIFLLVGGIQFASQALATRTGSGR